MTPPERPPETARDPWDALIDAVPRHIWASLAALTLMLLVGQLVFRGSGAPPVSGTGAVTESTLEGRVVALLETSPQEATDAPNLQRVLVEITRGEQLGQRVEIEYGERILPSAENRLRLGDRVLVERSTGGPFGDRYYVSDFVRLPALILLILLFAALTVVVGLGTGLRALASVGFTVLALAGYFVPGITSGHDPLLVAVTGSFLLMVASLYLTYQWRPKTHAALAGVTVSLLLASLLTVLFGQFTRLTGFGTEDAVLLLGLLPGMLDPRGLLWAGIVIGAVGVLDDVAVGQASSTFELSRANPGLGWRELFERGMVIGRDHIASMVNTLLLAYAGASLPLFLLLTTQELSLAQTLNREFLAEEIVRTLVGSLTLLLAVPITSLIASVMACRMASPMDRDPADGRSIV